MLQFFQSLQADPVTILAILLAAALAGGIIAHRLKQPVVLGYLVIGAVVGPHALGLVGNVELVVALASIGVTLLMFTLGLEISISQLREVGRVGTWGGICQIAATFILGVVSGVFLFHWSLPQSCIFGLIISLSSTAVCLKILMDRGEMSSVHGRIMLAILILQDVSVVLMMIVLPILKGVTGDLPLTVAISAAKGFLFVGAAMVAGRWIIPWLLGRIGGPRTRELFLMTILVICLAAAIGTEIAGLSVVFGAFLIGVVLRESKFAHQALAEIIPLRDIFATLFFVSLGMLLDPRFLLGHWQMVLLVVAAIVVIKVLAVFGVIRLFGYNTRIAILAGAGLFQIGEFAFILAQSSLDLGFTSADFYSLVISGAIITMLLTPISISFVSALYPRLESLFSPKMAIIREGTADPPGELQEKSGPVVIAGYGRVGEAVAKGLEDAEIPFVVIDIDPERITDAKCMDFRCMYGDAGNVNVLTKMDLMHARSLVITYPDPIAVETTVKTALSINPKLTVMARVHREKDAERLRKLGVTELISPEYEASFRFIKRILNIQGFEKNDRRRILYSFRND
jgi:CPA2 family monovalent cation:H+ antiporter-2